MSDTKVMETIMKEKSQGSSNAQIVTKLMQDGVDISQIRRVRALYERDQKQSGLGNLSSSADGNGISRMRTNNGKTRSDYSNKNKNNNNSSDEDKNYSNYRIKSTPEDNASISHTYDDKDQDFM
ncbi:MAG TPA: capsule biosynthesis protein, partial [Prevotella sp.]|nr:capsule biosynthesis protein [Prevotella sp.]